MEVNVEGIVELDKLNMSNILLNSNDEFSYDARKNELIKEISDGVKLIEYNHDLQLVGYIQYDFLENGNCFILSLQVHPLHRGGAALKSLLKSLAKELNKEKPSALISYVHISNLVSVQLHKRLKFKIQKEYEQKLKFIIEGVNLQNLINKFYE
ncbi:GCN5-related N-acetyltransferase [Moritella viscosa]|uniref:GNAT family N-acetyltransferase n=1 Tax=Moritella viscosa TaxID=80854 RepID=UPI000508E2A4|nr:GNAT family N-acetyltransferase [Moritella viscosa]CED61476.1 putative uncharacterized protein [Moritella viscosa]SHO05481.1 GCN5-related N-acetyltransferase [Moritella viscosa]SHO21435.1 GCN5-related N-acetyltransferase [Moritella viscosa]